MELLWTGAALKLRFAGVQALRGYIEFIDEFSTEKGE